MASGTRQWGHERTICGAVTVQTQSLKILYSEVISHPAPGYEKPHPHLTLARFSSPVPFD